MLMEIVVVLAVVGVGVVSAAQSPGLPPTATEKADLDRLAGQPVDIAPWAYAWRADRAVQEKPESHSIPRRLERINTVYRAAFAALPQRQLKSIY